MKITRNKKVLKTIIHHIEVEYKKKIYFFIAEVTYFPKSDNLPTPFLNDLKRGVSYIDCGDELTEVEIKRIRKIVEKQLKTKY